jgi:hypothetical protein
MTADTQQPTEYRPAGQLDIGHALDEYRGPWNERLAAHLLRRAGFGGSPQEIAAASRDGMEATVRRLLHFGPDPLPQAPQGDISFPIGVRPDPMQRRQAYLLTALWWLNRCLATPHPLQERMTYFWSNHFTSALGEKGITPDMIVGQYALFRRYALGNYAALTHAVTTDPAMLHYLDGIVNHAQHPNENYARELMELFTMGAGNYSEEDVRQAARAFTGFRVDRFTRQPVFTPRLHDDGIKTFLGRTGNFDGDDIIDIIMQQPATARFMARKFLRAFVYDDPEPELIDAVADRFRSFGYDVGRLMGVLLRSNVFYSARAYRALVKSPFELVIGTLKMLGASGVGVRTIGALVQMGQVPLRPPNVAGWPGGRLWLNTGTYLARLAYLRAVAYFRPAEAEAAMTQMQMQGPAMQPPPGMDPQAFAAPALGLAPPEQWLGDADGGRPSSVADAILDLTVQRDATSAQRADILTYLGHDGVGNRVVLNGENFEEKVRGAMSLAMALPAYQLA